MLPGSPSTTITYHYEDSRFAGGLTGKSFNGVRYSTFAYDSEGRAISTEHAGGVERYSFSYAVEGSEKLPLPPPPPSPGGFQSDDERAGCVYRPGSGKICYQVVSIGVAPLNAIASLAIAAVATSSASTQTRPTRFRVTETNPLGRKSTYLYENGKKVSVTGDASSHCPASYRELTYDANGYEDEVADFTGNKINFDYDGHGHLTKRVDAAGTRTTNYIWDEARNKVASVTVEGVIRTEYTYTTGNRVERVVVTDLTSGQTRTTTFRYTTHPSGLLATSTMDGPLPNDTVTSTHNTQGDLVEMKNALGQVVRYDNYNALGQPGRVTSPTGAVTDYEYDARGRVIVERTYPSGSPVEARYVYGASGLLEAKQSSDGNTFLFHYDAARRLVQEDVTAPSGGYEVRRTTYNAMSQPIRVEVGRD